MPARNAEKPRLSADDWARAGLDLLAREGFSAVSVERLARELGVTKGSFYWHFANRQALLNAMLTNWERNDLATFVRSVEIFKDPVQRLREFFRRTARELTSHVIFGQLFAATHEPEVRAMMERVARRRIEYLANGFENLGMAAEAAENRARLTFYSYVGFLQVSQRFRGERLNDQQLEAYVEHVIETLIPANA